MKNKAIGTIQKREDPTPKVLLEQFKLESNLANESALRKTKIIIVIAVILVVVGVAFFIYKLKK